MNTVTIPETEYDSLKADKARLDLLDLCNQRLNELSGTLYGWKVVISHNVNRLMVNFPYGVDLNDAEAVGCHPTGHLSVRKAIDKMACRKVTDGVNQDELVNKELIAWAKKWELDGDLCRCRECGRAIIYSRRNEALVHASGCKTHMAWPWELLTALTSPSSEKPNS